MRKAIGILLGIACMLAYPAFGADRLVVTRTGQSFWVSSVKQSGDVVEYVHRDTRQRGAVPVADLHGVMPTVQRGKLYQPDEVQKYIERTEKLIKLHPSLLRQLNAILQEWKAIQNPPEGLGDEISAVEEAFESSEKGPHDYQMAAYDLGMIKYKDLGGSFSARIETIEERIREEYIAASRERLAQMAATKDLSVDAFLEMKALSAAVMEEIEDGDGKDIEDMLSATRKTVYLSTCRKSMQILGETRSVDGYLECVRILRLNKAEVAADAEENATIDRGMAKLLSGIKSISPQFRFDEKGYPLNQDDVRLMGEMARTMSRITFVDSELDEQCLIIPEWRPGHVSLRSSLEVPLRLILNRGQKPDEEFAVGIRLLGAHEDRYARLGPVTFKDGHASVVLRTDFSELPGDFELIPNDNGETLVYVYLARLKDKNAKEGEEEWVEMSRCCGWPISR